MARRRRHRNRRRSLSRQLLQRFASHSHHQYLKESIQAGEQREQQREFLRRHRKLEDDIIARSVFVTNVLDANQPKNLDRLLHFMEGSYGGVEDCFPTEYSNNILSRYPPVRIIFRNEVDVELLVQMSNNNKSVTVPCPGVGYKNGCITIHRSKREQTLLARVLKRNRIQFTASGLSLGHWFPHDKDIYTSWREDSKTDKNDEWLEEHRLSSSAVQVSVNLTEREISFQLDTAASPFALSDFAFTKSEIAMLHSGLSASTDPFLFSCLMSIRAHHLYNVRKKARIFVKEGGVFLGGLDETKMLPEECVFLQVATERDGVVSYRPVLGPVMVTKHPVMHPGDIRMYLAVDIPNLRHLKDVLIFSQKGGRPEPSKMSGSDLDGDEFAVTWNESLFLKNLNWSQFAEQIRLQLSRALSPEELVHVAREVSKANSDPLDYDEPLRRQAVLLPDNDEAEQSQALLEHFFEYSKSDSLGYIGMLWQDYAGKYGANCKECIQLADLHSIAVDFAKTGVPAVVPDEIKWRDKHPHWRELKEKHSYHCGSIVGRLYDEAMGRTDTNFSQECRTAICGRAVNKYGQVLSLVEVEWDPSCLEAVYDSGLASALGLSFNEADSALTNHLLEFASDQRESYEDQVSPVMNKFHLRNEGELFTGCIRKYHKFDKKRQQAVSEDVRRQCHAIRGEYRDNFFHEVLLFASEDNEADNLATQLQTLSLEETNISRIIATLTDIDQVTLEGDAASNPMLFRFDEGFERVLSWVEGIATQQNPPSSRFSLEWKLRKFAHMLAAAYYVVSYSPDGREELNNLALFSFPWMVSDVIASGLRDHASGSL